ncbi:MAG TPA: hypothetical protein VKB85_15940 [Propionibacteriaceae bacterium]|nr:hypothetical protein [Propionibacteriaceae bacterium]
MPIRPHSPAQNLAVGSRSLLDSLIRGVRRAGGDLTAAVAGQGFMAPEDHLASSVNCSNDAAVLL